MRFSAMLFALSLKAATVCAAGSHGTASLMHQRVGSTRLHFCVHEERQLLLVLSVPAALGKPCTSFLASELLGRFDACFAEQLDAGMASVSTPRSVFKRRAFARGLSEACAELPGWILRQLLHTCPGCTCTRHLAAHGPCAACKQRQMMAGVAAVIIPGLQPHFPRGYSPVLVGVGI